ncbi:MAG: exo-alpha-sialidase, partial [Deltaproteobacteria bacterium]|nr:exo-alpha-sialidase [Deltaproteobacteria bacterium]
MRNVLWLLGGALLATQVCGVAAAQEPALFGEPFPLSRTASTSVGDDARPHLTTDGQGTWVAVWYASDSLGGTIGTDYDILVARSTDDGVTWTPPVALNTNAGSDGWNDIHPQVATDGEGTWVAVWNGVGDAIGAEWDILVARSTDGGGTWTAPVALNTNAGNDAGDDLYPQLATDGQGNWVVVWQSDDSLAGTIGGDDDILVARSTDGGATWTPPAALDTSSNEPDCRPQLATDREGNWVAVFQREPSEADTDIWVARSTDAGATWTSPAQLHSSNDQWDWYADVNADGMGNWVAVWTWSPTGGPDSDIRVARSTDAGATWSSAAHLHPSNSGFDWVAMVTTDGQGTWVTVWQSDDSLEGTIGTDYDILVARSTNAGATWTAPAALNANAGSDAGDDWYPGLTTDGQGNWLAVWYSYDSLRGTIGADSDILLARSTDSGANWTAPAALNGNADSGSGDDFAPQVTTDGQGAWVAVWDSNDSLDGTIETDSDILVVRSTQGGETRSAPVALNTNADSDAGDDFYSQLTTDGLGNWVAVWHSFDSLEETIETDGDILVARSADAGATWAAPFALNTNAASDAGDDLFPQLTTDGLGAWVAVWDSTDTLGGTLETDGDILVARSTNAGATWSAPVALNTNAASDAGGDFVPQVTTDGQGNWVAVWDSDDSLGGTLETDGDILVARSTNAGVTWTDPVALNTNA